MSGFPGWKKEITFIISPDRVHKGSKNWFGSINRAFDSSNLIFTTIFFYLLQLSTVACSFKKLEPRTNNSCTFHHISNHTNIEWSFVPAFCSLCLSTRVPNVSGSTAPILFVVPQFLTNWIPITVHPPKKSYLSGLSATRKLRERKSLTKIEGENKTYCPDP